MAVQVWGGTLYLCRAKSETAALQLTNLVGAVQLFYIDLGRYPSQAEGLPALVTPCPGEPRWAGPYISTPDALTDPSGRDDLYTPTQTTFTISSLGRDGTTGGSGEDTDITKSP